MMRCSGDCQGKKSLVCCNPMKGIPIMSESAESSDQTAPRILVMDDEHHVRDILRKVLEKFGYPVDLTEDGEAAVSHYKTSLEAGTPVGLVILDLSVPGGMGGKEASEKILAIDPQAKIIISSGNPNDPLLQNYQESGIQDILAKPYRLDKLKTKVQEILSQ